ncbi:hypothetical protein C0995_010476, partial [Termitomyces sp. Mi166
LAKNKEGCLTCGSMDHWLKNCPKNDKNKVYIQATQLDTESEPEEGNGGNKEGAEVNNDLVEGLEGLAKQLEQDEVKSILINGKEYITVDVYNNDCYSCNNDLEYMW